MWPCTYWSKQSMYLYLSASKITMQSISLPWLNFRINAENHMLSPEVTKTYNPEESYFLMWLLLSHMLNYKYLQYFSLYWKIRIKTMDILLFWAPYIFFDYNTSVLRSILHRRFVSESSMPILTYKMF